MNNPLYTYIKGDDISEDRVKELLQIQSEQLAEWKLLLCEKAYEMLKEWVDKQNETLESYMLKGDPFWISDYVKRGFDLTEFVLNINNDPYMRALLIKH